MRLKFWKAEPIWRDETCFIIGGGPSLCSVDISSLRRRNVIVVNSSYQIAPWAPYLFAMDTRFLRVHQRALINYSGHIITVSTVFELPGLKRMRKVAPPGLTKEADALAGRRTSTQSAINLAYHFGVSRIVLLGIDCKSGRGGRTHHHKPHKWPQKADCYTEQYVDLLTCVKPLNKAGVEVVNASPNSRLDFWPKTSLEEYLENEIFSVDRVRPKRG